MPDTTSLRVMLRSPVGPPGATRLFSPEQRARLSALATCIRLPARTTIYKQDGPADYVFITASGVVKVYQDLPSGKRHIMSFWFPEDIFGLAENGRFVYTAQAVTSVMLYRFPREVLKTALLRDAALQFQFLSKVTHEFRKAQRAKILLIRRNAAGRVAMFLSMLEQQAANAKQTAGIDVPMSRSDIANYLGLTLEAVSRAMRELTRDRLIAIPDRHLIKILDRSRFDKLVADV